MSDKPILAVSSCLLGQRVRYNGDAAEFRPLTRKWANFLKLVPVCPEVGIGMGTPRPTIRLVKLDEKITIKDPKNDIDYTEDMTKFAELKSDYLAEMGISGFVFKKDSPSCGLERVKVYRENNPQATRDGRGLFSMIFTSLYPQIPVIEEGRLTDPKQAEHFLARVHFYHEWQKIGESGWTEEKLQNFHDENSLFLLSRSPESSKELESYIASMLDNGEHVNTVALGYMTRAQEYLSVLTRDERIANGMEQVMERFSQRLTSEEKQELGEVITHFREGIIPRYAPMVLLNHYLSRFEIQDRNLTRFTKPVPIELGLMARI